MYVLKMYLEGKEKGGRERERNLSSYDLFPHVHDRRDIDRLKSEPRIPSSECGGRVMPRLGLKWALI